MSERGPDTSGRPGVRAVEAKDISRLTDVLVAAFYDDPVTIYLFPSERSRKRRLERYFRLQLKRIGSMGGLALTTDDLDGVSLWLLPKRREPSFAAAIGQLFGVASILGANTGRAVALSDQLYRIRPKEAHFYLAGIGVDPPRQRTGLGSLLLGPMLARADEEALPVYLESSREENISFYLRHRFEVTGEVGSRKGSSPRLWCMRRPPSLREP